MIKIKGIENIDTLIEVDYIEEDKIFNITTGLLSDESLPFRVANRVMFWVSEEGYIGEIESIFPEMNKKSQCKLSQNISKINGFPIIEIESCDNIEFIEIFDKQFIIWLEKEALVDSIIEYKNVSFLTSKSILVGIEAKL